MFKTVMVPLDGSSISEQVIPTVIKLGKCFPTANFVLLEVIKPLGSNVTGVLAFATVSEIQTITQEEAIDYLKTVASKFPTQCNMRLMAEEGMPVNIILKIAREANADLIAMASHGRSGVARLTLGSVTDRVISQAEIPVLVVKAHQ